MNFIEDVKPLWAVVRWGDGVVIFACRYLKVAEAFREQFEDDTGVPTSLIKFAPVAVHDGPGVL